MYVCSSKTYIKKYSREDEKKIFKVAYYESCSKFHLTSVERVKTAVRSRHSSNLRELRQITQGEWGKLSVEKCRNLMQSYRKCMTEVIASKGYAAQN